jgi:phage terminase large subunit-like protein
MTTKTIPASRSFLEKPNADQCQKCGWSPEGGLWPSHGGVAVKWIQRKLILADGDSYGKPFKLRDDQKLFLWRWYEFCQNCDQWRYNRALRMAATGDGKTQFIAAIVCLEFAGPKQIVPTSPIIPIAAASFEQADLLFSAVSTMLGSRDPSTSPAPLRGLFHVFDTEIMFADGRPGKIHRIAAVAGTNEGGLPTLFVCDELHEWGDVGAGSRARVHMVVGKSTNKRQTAHGSGRIINISTAGFDKDHSLLGVLYLHAKRVIHNPSLDPRLLVDIHEAPEGLNFENPEDRAIAVRAASSGADVIWSVADRVAAWNDPTVPKHEWIRYYGNRWADIAEGSWLQDHPGAWAKCSGEWISDQANAFVISVDMALKHDSVAVDRVELLPDGRYAVTSKIWEAKDHGGIIPHADVWRWIKDQATGEGFQCVVYDPRYFEVPARLLEEDGIQVLQFDQSPQRMAPACGFAFKLITETMLVHDGDPDLGLHVRGAVAVPQERGGFTLKKSKSKTHIDACVALAMGVWALAAMLDELDGSERLDGALFGGAMAAERAS